MDFKTIHGMAKSRGYILAKSTDRQTYVLAEKIHGVPDVDVEIEGHVREAGRLSVVCEGDLEDLAAWLSARALN